MWSNKLKEMEKSSNPSVPETADAMPEIPTEAPNDLHVPVSDISVRDMISYGTNVSSLLTELVIAHPFLVLRHQCQVRSWSKVLHLQPFSLLPIMNTYVTRQGIVSLWKGLSGVVTVRIIRAVSENVLSETLSLPKDITVYSSASKVSMNLLLKTLSWVIATPFYTACMVEFVQSDIASEPTTLVSCLLEGLRRVLPAFPPTCPRMGSVGGKLKAGLRAPALRTASRLLPVWRLLLPVTALGLGSYCIRTFVGFAASAYLRRHLRCDQPEQIYVDSTAAADSMKPGLSESDQNLLNSHRRETMFQSTYSLLTTDLTADLISSLAADVILYPLETIVVRLCVQGTRTLVDNLDTGDSVIPIISSFYGPTDVLKSASTSASGFMGLYRGFGALVLQYAVQAALVVGVKYAYEHYMCYYSSSPAQPPPTIAPQQQGNRNSSSIPPTTTEIDAGVYKSTPFYSSVNMYDLPGMGNPSQPVSTWQSGVDVDRWRSSDPVLSEQDVGSRSASSSSAFVFRGYNPGPYDAPL